MDSELRKLKLLFGLGVLLGGNEREKIECCSEKTWESMSKIVRKCISRVIELSCSHHRMNRVGDSTSQKWLFR